MKTSIKIFIFIFVLCLTDSLLAQNNKIKLGIQSGWFKANNYYKDMLPGWNIGGEASYYISESFFLSAHYNYGTGYYLELRRTRFPYDSWNQDKNNTNATLKNYNFGILAGYNWHIINRVNISAQFGFAQFIEICNFPIRVVRPDVLSGWSSGEDISGTHVCLAFPAKCNIGFMLTKNLELSIAGGFYIEPDYKPAIVGLYIGPQISVVF